MKKKISSSKTDCPCCSGYSFADCCKPMLSDYSPADTPEKLMRSRYTAFVMHDHEYLLRTWLKNNRPRFIKVEINTTWLNLEITKAALPSPEESIAHVSFIASFLQAGVFHKMKETSSFVLIDDQWYYRDGDTKVHTLKVKMNSKCPCGSDKKFKRCCHQ